MYAQAIAQCVQAVRSMETYIDKAERFANAKKFDVNVLLSTRLAPDMAGLLYQIQSACDYLKGGAAWLSGQQPPKHDDSEYGQHTYVRCRHFLIRATGCALHQKSNYLR